MTYSYDPLNVMSRLQGLSNDSRYLYTADDERIVVRRPEPDGLVDRFYVRGFSGELLREYAFLNSGGSSLVARGSMIFADGFESGDASNWSCVVGDPSQPPCTPPPVGFVPGWNWSRDYYYRGDRMLAVELFADPTPLFAYPDHLGTPVVLWPANGDLDFVETTFLTPFGEETSEFPDPVITKRFTGHERDGNLNIDVGDDLDYMHARFCSPLLGRFLGMDPVLQEQAMKLPQLWNRYSYSLNNPLRFVDRDGRDLSIVFDFRELQLSAVQRARIARAVSRRFEKAGAGKVRTVERRGPRFINLMGTRELNQVEVEKGSPSIEIRFTSKEIGSFGYTAGGSTTGIASNARAPETRTERFLFLVNVATHEGGHALGWAGPVFQLQKYWKDGLGGPAGERGSVMGPSPFEPAGSPESAAWWGSKLLEFSTTDANAIRESIGEPGPEQP